MSVNRSILAGYVGQDAKKTYLPSGDPVLSFSLATTDRWKDKRGQKQERTEWHHCELFGKLADVIAQYVTKGQLVHVIGQIRYEEWTDKDQIKRKSTKIRVKEIQLLGGPRGERQDQPSEKPFVATDDDVPFMILAAIPFLGMLV